MALVTFQILEGLERGEVLEDLSTPVTIGREEDNLIRLNDERVSRFHAKVQENDGRVILTDLESTNGTRVNGHAVKMRVLQIGDQLLIGRCLLVFGSPEEVAAQNRRTPSVVSEEDRTAFAARGSENVAAQESADREELFPQGPPDLPGGLKPLQAAQLSDVLGFVHARLHDIMVSATESLEKADQPADGMIVPTPAWRELQALQFQLAKYLSHVVDPVDE